MFTRTFYLILFWSIWVGVASTQTPFITVTDSKTNSPLSGAHVFISSLQNPETKQYEITDFKGQIKNTIKEKSQIKVSYLGYVSITDTISPGQSFVFSLNEDQKTLNTFIVTSHAVPTRIDESVYQVKVIDRKRIESQGAINLRDLLTNDLNMRLSQDNILGSGIKMQGVGGENIKIMIDGVPVIGRLDGNIDLSQINLNNIERVEIIEGPSSVNYGSNALGGVINLITKKSQNHTLEGNLHGYYETVGNFNADARIGWKHKQHFLQISGGRYFFDGFTTNDSIRRYQTWKPKEQYFADLNYGIGIGTMNLRYQGNFFQEIIQSKGAPESPFYVTAVDQYFRTLRTTHGLFLTGFLKKNHHLDITASYSYYNRRSQNFYKDLVSLEQNLVSENTDVFNLWMSRGIYNYSKPNGRIGIQAGYELNIETAEGIRILDGRQDMGDYALFTSAEIRFLKKKNLVLKPAMRFGYNSRYSMPVIPSVHIKYTPLKGLDFRVSYARGFRAPSLKELYFLFVDVNHNLYGNPDLLAETSNNFNARFSYSGEKNKFTYGISLSGFYNDIENQIRSVAIAITPDSNIYRNENIARFQSLGGQFNLNFGYKEFNISLGAIYTGVMNDIGSSNPKSKRFVYYPEFQSNASYQFKWWDGQLNVFFKYSGDFPFLYVDYDEVSQEEVIREGKVNGFGNLDISYVQNLFKKRVQIGLYGKNLLNVTNVQQTSGVGTGGAHSSGSSSLPTLWGASFGVSLKYNFIVN